MGPTLIVNCNITGITINFSDTRPPGHEMYEGFYHPSTNTITMYEKDKDYVLLEEMFHDYQRNHSWESYYSANNEIEAKLMVWEYCKRHGINLAQMSPNSWGVFGKFAENPTEANWGYAMQAIGVMGYMAPQFPVSEFNDFKKNNYNNMPCH